MSPLIARLAGFATAVFVLSTVPTTAFAIPSFARKYETSCQTCHTAYPQLTPFGEAFRRNGYRFPEGQDEERSEDEPLELGQEIHRDLFPDELWPGEIPGQIPIAVSLLTAGSLQRGEGGHGHGSAAAVDIGPEEDEEPLGFGFGGSELGLLMGGTLGERISFFGKVEVGADGDVELERPQVIIAPLRAPLWLIKVGAFEPSLHPFSVHRGLSGHSLAFTTVSLGDNAWAPEPQQLGVESSGVSWHRIGWVLGLVEGAGNSFNRDKDVYSRVEYKFGGMSLDGFEPSGYNRPWQELSATLGGAFYFGNASLNDPAGGGQAQSDRFWRANVDLKAVMQDATLIVGASRQRNQRPTFGSQEDGNLDGLLAELDYVVWPWLIPLARYELFRQELEGSTESGHRVAVGFNALLRANITIRALAFGRRDADRDPELQEVSLALQTAF